MAVPSSGTLSLQKLAKEKVLDDYNSSSSVTGGIHLADLVLGGNEYGSPTYYDETNNNSSSKPNETGPHSMSEWYGYDHDTAGGFGSAGSFSFKYSTTASAACGASTVTVYVFASQDWYKDSPITSSMPTDIYSSSALTSYASAGWYSDGNKRRYWDGNGTWGSKVTCSVTSSTYYYDASTALGACDGTATTVYWESSNQGNPDALLGGRAIYTNSGLTSIATAGYYNNGVQTSLWVTSPSPSWDSTIYTCQDFTSTLTVGNHNPSNNPDGDIYGYFLGFYTGFSGNIGSMSNTSFGFSSPATIYGLYWTDAYDTGTGRVVLQLSSAKAFDSITINGTLFSGTEIHSQSNTRKTYQWSNISTNPFGTSGSISITANY